MEVGKESEDGVFVFPVVIVVIMIVVEVPVWEAVVLLVAVPCVGGQSHGLVEFQKQFKMFTFIVVVLAALCTNTQINVGYEV